MARKRSKRKRSSREDFMLHEQLKIESGVFDNRTMMQLSSFFTHGIISRLDFIVAKGKEADVYIADSGVKVKDDFVIVKIFRIETSHFLKRMDYISGDPRFGKIKGGIFQIVHEWCKKEFGNLKIAQEAKIHAPKPYFFAGNILGIELIGIDGEPSIKLKEMKLKEPEKILKIIISDMRKLYRNNLVHGDLSEFNILVKEDTPYIIDFGQAVVLGHPNAISFLKRDIYNVLTYFRKTYGIEKEEDKVFEYITNQEPENLSA